MATLAAISPIAPSLVMTYWNPIEKYGVEKFLDDLKSNGGSGAITPDLTIEESERWIAASTQSDTNRIYVVAPSTSPERLRSVTAATSGFIYAASLMGVTGTRTSISSNAEALVARLRQVTELPIAVGLGVSTPEQAQEVAQYADGVIVGSAFIRLLQESQSLEEGIDRVRELAQNLSKGLQRL